MKQTGENLSAYWGWEQFQQYLIKTTYRNEGRDETNRLTTFNYHLKSTESWVNLKNLAFCKSYNTSTLFPNLLKRSLTCRKLSTLQTPYTLWYTVRLSIS